MSINPNTQFPLNIDQEITQLNRTFQEFDAIDRKKKINNRNDFLIDSGFLATIAFASITSAFAFMIFAEGQTAFEEIRIRKVSVEYPQAAIVLSLLFFMGVSSLFFLGLRDKNDRKLAVDPLVARYLKDRKLKNPHSLDFSEDVKQNTSEYNYLNNFKIVMNSETGKTLPDDVWNVISDYYFKKIQD